MKMDHNITQTSTALLRITTGVDKTETNSLCCAAAGIIALFSATAESRIPHEKLREAATFAATRIAPNRPPAQPVAGYSQVVGAVASPWPIRGRSKSSTDQGIGILGVAA